MNVTDILLRLSDGLADAQYERDTGDAEASAIADAERQLGRKLTGQEYNNAFNQSEKLIHEDSLTEFDLEMDAGP